MTTQILLVEDEAQIRENVAELLTLHGFQVETAVNGREGISQALLQQPDLILCDIMMPEVDGYQVLDVVRNNRSTANIPFIFLTAKTEPADLRRGMVMGADDYLTKPFTFQSLLSAIESRLQREAMRKADLKAQMENFRHSLASVSVHEYNTCLTGIIGFASMLTDPSQGFNGEETQMMLSMIKVSGLRLKRSLDNIQLMDLLQKMEPSHPEYAYYASGSSTISAELVTACVESIELRLDKKVDWRQEVATAQLQLSAINLKKCLEELIDNAFKFSYPDQTVHMFGEPDGAGYRFTITNSGQPFTPENDASIAPYVQFDRKKYEQQGFGIGLSIVRAIVELNNGRLSIESPSAGFTKAVIWLPRGD
ncbi:hybrid sensor histidine kinase/response regulator [Spirosoma linguale]|uniref:Response regulator receiver sensor signal transduction histidine kinase n=1 Tax=Spirosoma linguale (strain ATCC 33905 / DSM 74 / LMG 10896 / Claus 1) TaxID=504472 RepID=D2QJW9_SPILD|nr:response regulator receiver sensor signal transduction histidine kinase [Spirosoma linguale DSM 74]